MAFFSNTRVGYFPTQSNPILGTLNGAVTRAGNTVTLNNLTLILRTPVAASGSKSFTFTLNGTANVCPINVQSPNVNLGSFPLSTVTFSVGDTDYQRTISWSTSDGYGGSFLVQFPVAPTTPTVTSGGTGFRSILVTYGTTSFGAPNYGEVYLYGGTSDNPTTRIDSYNQIGTKTFTLTNVLPNTTYYFRAKATNLLKDSSYSSTISIKSQKDPKFLGGVDGRAKIIKKMYCSVDGKTKAMKFYGSAGGVTKRIF